MIIGIAYFIVYYLLFHFLIVKLDLKTPGRDDSDEVKLYRRSDVEARKNAGKAEQSEVDELSHAICNGLGGKKNISDVDCCATRLRCTVHKANLVNDELLKSTGASGVIHKGNGVQIIYGPRVTVIKSNLEDYLETAPDEVYVAKTDAIVIHSPVAGIAAELSTAPDDAFAQKMMGDGAVVKPTGKTVCAPEDGEVCFVFETKHAIGFQTKDGINMLLHMGIDTVTLNGEGFKVFVKEGQKVKKGETLMELDLAYLNENAPSMVSPILCTELSENQAIRLLAEGPIKAGDPLFEITEK